MALGRALLSGREAPSLIRPQQGLLEQGPIPSTELSRTHQNVPQVYFGHPKLERGRVPLHIARWRPCVKRKRNIAGNSAARRLPAFPPRRGLWRVPRQKRVQAEGAGFRVRPGTPGAWLWGAFPPSGPPGAGMSFPSGAHRRQPSFPRLRSCARTRSGSSLPAGDQLCPPKMFSGEAPSQGQDVSPVRGRERSRLSTGLQDTGSRPRPRSDRGRVPRKTRGARCARNCTT